MSDSDALPQGCINDFEDQIPSVARGALVTQLFGSNITWLLLGFLTSQINTYFRHAKGDSISTKLIVYGTIIIQLLDTTTFVFSAYGYNVREWGNLILSLEDPLPSDLGNLDIVTVGVASATTQWFFTYRIWTFSGAVAGRKLKIGSRMASALVLLLSLCALGSCLAAYIGSYVTPIPSYIVWAVPLLKVLNVCMAAADILITICMVLLLSRAKEQTCFGGTRDTISRFIRMTLQSGCLTSLMAICGLALMIRGVGVYGIFWEALTKSYAISLFANLNVRSTHRRSTSQASTTQLSSSSRPRLSAWPSIVRAQFAPLRSAMHSRTNSDDSTFKAGRPSMAHQGSSAFTGKVSGDESMLA